MDNRYNTPENLIIKILIIAPQSIRPAVMMNPVQMSEDDLTHMYLSIISTNIEL